VLSLSQHDDYGDPREGGPANQREAPHGPQRARVALGKRADDERRDARAFEEADNGLGKWVGARFLPRNDRITRAED
jgi:hypothetical protein